DRGATDRRPCGEERAVPLEVSCPAVAARIEQPAEPAGERVGARYVRPLVPIAATAAERQVPRLSRPAVLPGDNVDDGESDTGSRLWQAAVLTGITRPRADLLGERSIHGATLSRPSRSQGLARL